MVGRLNFGVKNERLRSFVVGIQTGCDMLGGLCCVSQSGYRCVVVRDFGHVRGLLKKEGFISKKSILNCTGVVFLVNCALFIKLLKYL